MLAIYYGLFAGRFKCMAKSFACYKAIELNTNDKFVISFIAETV